MGFFQIGGGIAGDFPICCVPMLRQDMELTKTPVWSYFCQISDSTTSYGSYSGAVPNEKITRKLENIHTNNTQPLAMMNAGSKNPAIIKITNPIVVARATSEYSSVPPRRF